MTATSFELVDVFSPVPFGGNTLPVFVDPPPLDADQMLRITQELRHFEAVFVRRRAERRADVRVFDLFEELPFAGHPLLGAAAVLHRSAGEGARTEWTFALGSREVGIVTEAAPDGVAAFMDQGAPTHLRAPTDGLHDVAAAFSLRPSDLHPELPAEVVSTGLRYLIVPVVEGALERATVAFDLTSLVQRAGAEYAVLYDVASSEIRHWNNDGVVEDIATGSAAGTIGAYCARHGLTEPGTLWTLSQGRFTGRPSRLLVRSELVDGAVRVGVGGDVSFVGRGALDVLP